VGAAFVVGLVLLGIWAWGARRFAVALVAFVLGVRYDLFRTGSLYSTTAVWAADVVTAALVLLAFTIFLAPPRTKRKKGEIEAGTQKRTEASWESQVATLGVAIALPAGLIGAVQLAAPTTPHAATAPGCAGASVAGGHFLATTSSVGSNARSGPATSYPQVRRFSANCTLAFDGYCIGEPTDDLIVKDGPDQRWLILHRPWESWPWNQMFWAHQEYAFVAAGKVQSQSPESKLGDQPDPQCPSHGGWQRPKPLKLTTSLAKGVVTARATAVGADLIGISIMSTRHPEDGSDTIFYLTNPEPKRTDPQGSITATWNAETLTGKAIGAHRATFTLIASVCLAPAVPAPDNYAVGRFAWNGKAVSSLSNTSTVVPEKTRVLAEACRVAPDYPNKAP
jgi:hypothetical protein